MTFRKKTGLILVIGAVCWLGTGLWLTHFVRSWLSEKIRSEYGEEFKLGFAKTNFLNSITLTDLELKKPVSILIPRLEFSFRPWRLIFSGPDSGRIFHLALWNPKIQIKPPLKETQPPNTQSGGVFFTGITVELRNAHLDISMMKDTITFTNVSGLFNVSSTGINGNVRGGIEEGGSFSSKLQANLAPPYPWRTEISIENLDLAKVGPKIQSFSGLSIGSLKGQLIVDTTINGSFNKKLVLRDWDVQMRGEDCHWQPKGTAMDIPFSPYLKFSPGELLVVKSKIADGLWINGSVRPPWSNPILDIDVRSSVLSIATLFKNLSIQSDLVAGTLEGTASITGTLSNPTISGKTEVVPSYWKIQFPSLSGTFSVKDTQLKGEALFSGGKLRFDGSSKKAAGGKIHILMEDVSLNEIGKMNEWQNVFGILNSELIWDIRENNLNLLGKFNINELRWGRLQSNKKSSGKIKFNNNNISVDSEDNSITVAAHLVDSVAHLDTFQLDFGNEFTFSANGRADLKKETLNFRVTGSKIQPDLWPPLVSNYPDIQGFVDFTGTVAGLFSDPQIKLDLVAHKLRFLPEGGEWNGTMEIVGAHKYFQLNRINIDGGYNGNVSWTKTPVGREGIWSVNISLLNSNPRLLWDVFKSTEIVDGSLSGDLMVEWDGSKAVGQSSMTWASGQIGDFRFDQIQNHLIMRKDIWEIEDFILIKGPKAIKASGQIKQTVSDWDFDATLQMQRWGADPFTLDGELRSTGKLSKSLKNLTSKIWAPILWTGDTPLENVRAQLSMDQSSWILRGDAGSDTKYNLIVDRKSGRLSGSLSGQSYGLVSMFQKFAPTIDKEDIPSGTFDFHANLLGTVDNPNLKLQINIDKGSWRSVNFDASLELDSEASTVTIHSSKINFQREGVLNLQGRIGTGESGSFDLKGTGTNIDFNSLFHLLKWPLKWEGNSDLTFGIKREKGRETLSVEFEGEHNGFGPFQEGGMVTGRIVGDFNELDLTGLLIESGSGYVKLLEGSKIFLDRLGAGTMRLNVESRNINAGYLTFFGNLELVGSWPSRKEGDFSEIPPVELNLFARSLWINQFVLDGNVTHLTLRKEEMDFSPIPGSGQQLSGVMIYKNYPSILIKDFRFLDGKTEKVYLDGFIGADYWDFSLNMKEIDANLIQGVFDTSFPISGPMSINLKGRGTPENPILEATLDWEKGKFGFVPLDSAECEVFFENGTLDLKNILVNKKRGYQLQGDIRMNIKDDQEDENAPPYIDLRLDRGDLTFLNEVFPEIKKARGYFEGNLKTGIKKDKPFTTGIFSADKIQIRSDYTPKLDKGVLDLEFNDNRLSIQRATATIGEGTIILGGHIDFERGRPGHYNLFLKSITEDGISIRIPELAIGPGPVLGRFGILKKKLAGISKGEPTVDIQFTGPASSPTLSGTLNLINTVFTYPPAKLERDKNQTTASKWMKTLFDKIIWDLRLEAKSRTWYQNELVNAAIDGALTFSGPSNELTINGRIKTEQGAIVYSGNEFKIKNADLEIETKPGTLNNEPEQIYIYLRAVAEKDVYYTDSLSINNQDTIIMTVDRSLLGEIQPRFSSRNNQNLSSQRALQLALGLPFSDSIDNNTLLPDQRRVEREKTREETDKLLRIGLVQLLDSSLASPLARAIAQHTGLVDFIRVTYQEKDSYQDNGEDLNQADSAGDVTQNEFLRYAKGTKVKFGRGLSSRLFADYSFRVDEYQEKIDLRHEVELAYRLRQNFFLRGITELDSERTLGRPPDRRAILENQWRFGLPRRKKAKPPEESRWKLRMDKNT